LASRSARDLRRGQSNAPRILRTSSIRESLPYRRARTSPDGIFGTDRA
jgi:hypothetical protein